MKKIKRFFKNYKTKLVMRITALVTICVLITNFFTGCTAVIGGTAVGMAAVPMSVGWLFFYDGNDGNQDLDLSHAILNFGNNLTEIGKRFLAELVDEKEFTIFGWTIEVPFINVTKIFDPTVFSLDPIKMCAIYGAKIMQENPDMTEEELKHRIENMTDEEMEQFLFNEDDPENSYLVETEVYVYTKADGTVLTETQAQALITQSELDTAEIEELQVNAPDLETLRGELAVLESEMNGFYTNYVYYRDEEIPRCNGNISYYQNAISNMTVNSAADGEIMSELQLSLTLAKGALRQAESERDFYQGRYNTYNNVLVPNKRTEVQIAEDIQGRIEELQGNIEANTVTVTIEMTYVPREDYPAVDTDLVDLTYRIMWAIVNGG